MAASTALSPNAGLHRNLIEARRPEERVGVVDVAGCRDRPLHRDGATGRMHAVIAFDPFKTTRVHLSIAIEALSIAPESPQATAESSQVTTKSSQATAKPLRAPVESSGTTPDPFRAARLQCDHACMIRARCIDASAERSAATRNSNPRANGDAQAIPRPFRVASPWPHDAPDRPTPSTPEAFPANGRLRPSQVSACATARAFNSPTGRQ